MVSPLLARLLVSVMAALYSPLFSLIFYLDGNFITWCNVYDTTFMSWIYDFPMMISYVIFVAITWNKVSFSILPWKVDVFLGDRAWSVSPLFQFFAYICFLLSLRNSIRYPFLRSYATIWCKDIQFSILARGHCDIHTKIHDCFYWDLFLFSYAILLFFPMAFIVTIKFDILTLKL